MRLLILVILTVLWQIQSVIGGHFNGGFITAFPKAENATSITFVFEVRFSYTRNYTTYATFCDDSTIQSNGFIGNTDDIICKVGCNFINEIIGTTYVECTAYSVAYDWSMGEYRFEHTIPKISNYQASYSSNNWRGLNVYTTGLTLVGDWEMRLRIDGTTRADTKKVNSSPYTFVPPVVVLKIGTVFQLKMPKYDPDGDVVKCRWSKFANNECASICNTVPFANLDTENCIITFDLRNATLSQVGWYGAALQIEDFYTAVDKNAISSAPLQFLINVQDNTTPVTCSISPTLPSDSCLSINSGTIVRLNITANASCPGATIEEIEVIGPYGTLASQARQIPGIASQSYSTVNWDSTGSPTNVTFLCSVAVDTNYLSSTISCITILIGLTIPTIQSNKANPKGVIDITFTGSSITFQVSFSMAIYRPNFQTFIHIYYSNGTELTKYDCSNPSSVQYSSYGVTFKLSTTNLYPTYYYITFDEGVGVIYNVLQSGCPLKSAAITSNTFWPFKIYKPIQTPCNISSFMLILSFYWFMYFCLHIVSLVIFVAVVVMQFEFIIYKFHYSHKKQHEAI